MNSNKETSGKIKPLKAVRTLKLNLEVEVHSYDNTIEIKIEDDDYEDEDYTKFTEKQLHKIAEQLVEKFNDTKVTVPLAIMCPNCKTQIDETDEKDSYHCSECNVKVKMEFLK